MLAPLHAAQHRARCSPPPRPARQRAARNRYSRFMQADPLGCADGMNGYAYVGADPVNRIDPVGLQSTYSGRTTHRGSQPQPAPFGGGSVGFAVSGPNIGLAPQLRQMSDDVQDNAGGVADDDIVVTACAGASRPECSTGILDLDFELPRREQRNCLSLQEPITYASGGMEFVLGVGGGFDFVWFRGLESGGTGWAATGSFMLGWGGSVGVGAGGYRTLNDLVGPGARLTGQVRAVPGTSYNFAFSTDGELIGVGGSIAAGGGLYGGLTRGRLLSSSIPIC